MCCVHIYTTLPLPPLKTMVKRKNQVPKVSCRKLTQVGAEGNPTVALDARGEASREGHRSHSLPKAEEHWGSSAPLAAEGGGVRGCSVPQILRVSGLLGAQPHRANLQDADRSPVAPSLTLL